MAPSRARSDLWRMQAGNATNLAHRIWMAASRANSNLWWARAAMSAEYSQIASAMATSRTRSDLWRMQAGNATNLVQHIWMAASRANSNLWWARAAMSVEYNQIASAMAPSRTQLRYMVECGQRPEPALSRPACVAVNMARAKNTQNRNPRFAVSQNAQDSELREP